MNIHVQFGFNHICSFGPLQVYVFCSDMKFKMVATAELSLTLVSIIQGVSEKKRFETCFR
jgi:hypothetical protein